MPLAFEHLIGIALAAALVIAPHATRLPWWLTALAAAMCLWRIYLARSRDALPARWLLVLIVAATAASIHLYYHGLFGRDAGVALLALMMALKLMETRQERDGMVVICIGYFLVLTSLFYSQSIVAALYLLGCVWVLTTVMLRLQYRTALPPLRRSLRAGGVLLLQSLPLMAILFLLFPRVQGPLWGMPADAFSGASGLSDSMRPGTISQLVLSDDIAFRAEFQGAIPLPNRLYWRGPVLTEFDGATWTALPTPLRTRVGLARGETRVSYTVTLEPHAHRWLFALDMPTMVAARSVINADNQMLALAPVNTRIRYDLQSALDYQWGADATAGQLRRATRLPPGYNPRTVALGQTLRQRYSDAQAIVNGALALLREQKFTYTLEPPLLGRDSADDFLFNTRAGFCEHFASSFAVLMRAAGVPTRVVTGYLGGDYNPIGNYLMVRQLDAHAWTEVWIEGRGWVRVDPTSAVSPQRADNGIGASLPAGSLLPGTLRNARNAWLRELGLTLDSVANVWNQAVLGYNLEMQRALLSRAGLAGDVFTTLAWLLIAATALATAVLVLLSLRAQHGKRDPLASAYAAWCRKLARAGLRRAETEGPADFAARVSQARPDLAPAADAVTRLYIALRYGGSRDTAALHEFTRRVRRFAI